MDGVDDYIDSIRSNKDKMLASAIKQGADSLGVSPEDYGTAMSYESSGTFDPWKKGPVTKWGQHRGTIQYGEPQQKQYGVAPNQSVIDQITNSNVRYLKDKGVKPGMGFDQIYAAINGGSVRKNLATQDANTGRTIADNIRNANAGHRETVRNRFGQYWNPDTSVDGYIDSIKPQKQGIDDYIDSIKPPPTNPTNAPPPTIASQAKQAVVPQPEFESPQPPVETDAVSQQKLVAMDALGNPPTATLPVRYAQPKTAAEQKKAQLVAKTLPQGQSSVQVSEENYDPVTGNVIPDPNAPQMYKVSANNADNAVVDTIDFPKGMNESEATNYVLSQLRAKYPQGDFSKQTIKDYAPEMKGVQVSIGALKQAGVDTEPIIRQKVAEHRVENPTPDLRQPTLGRNTIQDIGDAVGDVIMAPVRLGAKYLTPETGQAVADAPFWQIPLFGYSKAPSGLVGGLANVVGDLAGMTAGAMKMSPVYGAVNEIVSNGGRDYNTWLRDLGKEDSEASREEFAKTATRKARDVTADEFLNLYRNANAFSEATGAKDASGKETIPSMVIKGVGQTPEYIALSLLPGGLITGLPLKNALLARAEDKPWNEVVKQGAWGVPEGALFHFLPKGTQKALGLVGEGTLKQIGTIGAPVIEAAGIGSGMYGLESLKDPNASPEDKLKSAIALGLMHFYGATKGAIKGQVARVADPTSNIEAYVKIEGPDKAVFVEKQKPDFTMVMPDTPALAPPRTLEGSPFAIPEMPVGAEPRTGEGFSRKPKEPLVKQKSSDVSVEEPVKETPAEPSQVTTNASGESGASQEAINRTVSEARKGESRVVVDTRSGDERPLIGVEASDYRAKPYESIEWRGGKRDGQVIEQGTKVSPAYEGRKEAATAKRRETGTTDKPLPLTAPDSPENDAVIKAAQEKARLAEALVPPDSPENTAKIEAAKGGKPSNTQQLMVTDGTRVGTRETIKGMERIRLRPSKGNSPIDGTIAYNERLWKPVTETKSSEPPVEAPKPVKEDYATRKAKEIGKEDVLLKARAVLAKKSTQFNTGLDLETLNAYKDIASIYVEGGVRDFAKFSKAMLDEAKQYGHDLEPHIKDLWDKVTPKPIKEETVAEAKTGAAEPPEPPKTGGTQSKEPSRGTAPSGTAKRIEAQAIKDGITEGFDATTEYEKKHIDEQAEKVAPLVADNDQMTRIMRGTEPLPPDVNPAMFAAGVKAKADAVGGDAGLEMKYELANSKAMRDISESAQTMRFAQEISTDPEASALREIKKARTDRLKEVLKGRDIDTAIKEEATELAKTMAGAKQSATKRASTRQTWSDFAKSIQC